MRPNTSGIDTPSVEDIAYAQLYYAISRLQRERESLGRTINTAPSSDTRVHGEPLWTERPGEGPPFSAEPDNSGPVAVEVPALITQPHNFQSASDELGRSESKCIIRTTAQACSEIGLIRRGQARHESVSVLGGRLRAVTKSRNRRRISCVTAQVSRRVRLAGGRGGIEYHWPQPDFFLRLHLCS